MESQKGEDLVPWTTRLPPETRAKVKRLAAYEGLPEQEVVRRILESYFQGIGDIPERKSILDQGWPRPSRKKKGG